MFQRLRAPDERKMELLHRELQPLILGMCCAVGGWVCTSVCLILAADTILSLQRIGRWDVKGSTATATTPAMLDLISEMLLSIPVRISYLIPHMRHLVRPCIHALQSSNAELALNALRQLDLWVDVLTPDAFDNVMGDQTSVCSTASTHSETSLNLSVYSRFHLFASVCTNVCRS